MSFLEQLVAEWYEYSGYFVRTNVRTRKRSGGGWDMEIDVLAFSPSDRALVHVESSGDAASWPERKRRFTQKKFILSDQEYSTIAGTKVSRVEKIAVVGWSRSSKADLNWGPDIRVMSIPEFLDQIVAGLRGKDLMSEAVPEGFPLLRVVQMLASYGYTAA